MTSPYLTADLDTLAAAATRDALQGGHRDGDPVMAALYLETRSYMHGICALLASHLNETRGMPVVLIRGRSPGQDWVTRHAMACRCGEDLATAMVSAGRGFEVPVLDAAGGGTVGDRLPLYQDAGDEHQAIMGRDPLCSARWMWLPNPKRPPSDEEGAIRRLPALAHALGEPFDLRDALVGILGDRGTVPSGIEDSGLLEWLDSERPLAP
jgi:hypothetical protein